MPGKRIVRTIAATTAPAIGQRASPTIASDGSGMLPPASQPRGESPGLLLDGEKLEPELLDPFDVAVQLRLVDDLSGDDGRALDAFHLHTVEEVGEARVELAANDEAICGGLHEASPARRRWTSDSVPTHRRATANESSPITAAIPAAAA